MKKRTNTAKWCADALRLYLDDLKERTSVGHWRTYEGFIKNHIEPVIGNVKVYHYSSGGVRYPKIGCRI